MDSNMSAYATTYRLMTNEQLLNLATDRESLCPEAEGAFNSELAKRGLGREEIEEQAECVQRFQVEEAQRKPLAQTINGFGTKLYGKRSFGADGSFVTTLWVVFFWIPVIPLKSFRVRDRGISLDSGKPTILPGWSSSWDYAVLQKCSLDFRQVINVYVFMFLPFIGTGILDSIHAGWLVANTALALLVCMPWWTRQLARSGQ